jgi:LPS-assembly protein
VPRSYSLLATLFLAGALAAPAAVRAQAPPPPSGGGGALPAAPPPAAPAEAVPEGEIRVRADSYEYDKPAGLTRAIGTVDLRAGATRILADRAEIYEETAADGSVKRRFVAEGNVVFIRGEERLSGDRVEMDDSGRGFLDNAIGYVEPGVFVEGRRIERVDDDTYRVEGGRFTSCSQPNPRWMFQASSARIEVDDKIVATNALFKVKGVPAFYLPLLYYPIGKDGRSTGFLFPSFGYSSSRGYNLGAGFFWAMGRSADQTFSADWYSRVGYGFGHELRWAGASPSRGTFRTYVFRLTPQELVYDPETGEVVGGRVGQTEYDLDYNALQSLPGNVRATVSVRKYSDLLFQQSYQDNFNLASTRTERISGALEKDLRLAVLSAYVDTTSTYFGTDYTRIMGRAPGVSLRRFARPIGWGKVVFGLNATADSIRYGTQDDLDRWSRWDFAPTVSRPFSLSFLQFNPSFGYRFTRYGSRIAVDENDESAIVPEPLDRSFFETSMDMRGPTFARVFETPGLGYTDRVKHTIGPEISWLYRTRVEDFNSIPKFDGDDYYLGTNEVRYSLVQRFFAKRRGASGKPQPWEFFTWRITQTYYVQISDGQSNFDPNYSSSAFGPGFRPEHLSPLLSRWRVRPTDDVAIDYQLEYDVNFKQVRRQSAFGTLSFPRLMLQGNWSKSVRLSEDPAQRTVGAQTLRGTLVAELLPQRLSIEGSADYDLVRDILYQMRGQVRYAVQCCGLSVEHIRYNWNGRADKSWRFSLELANVGSTGTFLGAAAPGSRQGLGGYR